MGSMTGLAGEKLGLFARTGQLSLKSGEGPVEMQAQNGKLQLFAQKKLTISSTDDILFAGKKRVTLIGGGSYLRLEAGRIEYGTVGSYIRRAPRTFFAKKNIQDLSLKKTPLVDDIARIGFYDEQFRVVNKDGVVLSNVPYFIINSDGETFKGITDSQGLCCRIFTKEISTLTVYLGIHALEKWNV
ncbi:hypothetical protein B5M10_23065 [Pluralibacter gergoviae]|nr:hypothetical protein B5M10_23065 [Pluralibacter gergoviae]